MIDYGKERLEHTLTHVPIHEHVHILINVLRLINALIIVNICTNVLILVHIIKQVHKKRLKQQHLAEENGTSVEVGWGKGGN